MSSPHRGGRQGQRDRPARGFPGPVARGRRCGPDGPDVRYPERVRERAEPGHPIQPEKGEGRRSCRRTRRHCRRRGSGSQGLDQSQSGGAHPAVGRQGIQDARRHPGQPGAGRDPAVVPVAASHPTQGSADARAAGHPCRRRGGRTGRLRHRHPHREPVFHRVSHRPRREEHDSGVLLRHAGHQCRWFAPRGYR